MLLNKKKNTKSNYTINNNFKTKKKFGNKTLPLISIKPSNVYNTYLLPEVTQEMIKSYTCVGANCEQSFKIAKANGYSNMCLKKLELKVLGQKQKIDVADLKKTNSVAPTFRYYYLSYISKQNIHNSLYIAPIFSLLDGLIEHNIRPKMLYFRDNDLPKKIEKEQLERITNEYNIDYNVSELNKLIIEMPQTPSYNNVIVKQTEFYSDFYIPTYMLTKFPAICSSVIRGISELKKGGRLFIFVVIGIINPAYEWFYSMLSELFENVSIVHNPMANYVLDTNILIDCQRLKKELSPVQKDAFIKLANSQMYKYNYLVCGALTSEQVPIIDNVNLPELNIMPNMTANLLISQLRYIYISQVNHMCYVIKRYFQVPMHPDINYIKQVNRLRLSHIINYFDEHNIPYNKSYKVYIDKFDKSLINNIYSYTNPIIIKAIKYHNFKVPKLVSGKYTPNQNDEFIQLNKMATLSFKVKQDLLSKIPDKKIPFIIKQTTDSFARGVVRYINSNYGKKMQHPVMNSFSKLWEIFSIFPWFMAKTNPKIFFVAEAPGQWIYATKLYSKLNNKTPDWIATSLNPQYDLDGFIDGYGFIKNNPERWIWGADNTGDIFNIENQRWFRKRAEQFGPIDIVTGDGGMNVADPTLLQKLDFAQITMVLGCLGKGGSCCVKHFLPFIREIPITNFATGFFIQIMYLYYMSFDEIYFTKPITSSFNTGEFYIIGRGYNPISDDFYDGLLTALDKHEANKLFMNMNDIPNTFISQVYEFIKKLTDMNILRDDQTNLLLTCMLKKDKLIESKTECSKFLKPSYIKMLQDEQFKNWVYEHKFEPAKINV